MATSRAPTPTSPVYDLSEPSAILIGVEVSLGIMGLIGNALVGLTILRSKSLHSLTNYLLLNLAIADGLVCITGITNAPFFYASDPCTQTTTASNVEIAYSYIQRCVSGQSVFSLLLVTFERYMGIVHSLRHRNYFRRRKVIMLLLLVWLTPLILEIWPTVWFALKVQTLNCTAPITILHTYKDHPSVVIFPTYGLLLFAVPAAAMIWMYVKILKSLKQSAKRIQQLGIQGPAKELQRAKKRVVHTLLLVTIAFFVLILPEKIILLVNTLHYRYGESIPVQVQVMLTLVLTNSTINPVLYGLKNENFRREMQSTFCCCSDATKKQEAGNEGVKMKSTTARQQSQMTTAR